MEAVYSLWIAEREEGAAVEEDRQGRERIEWDAEEVGKEVQQGQQSARTERGVKKDREAVRQPRAAERDERAEVEAVHLQRKERGR